MKNTTYEKSTLGDIVIIYGLVFGKGCKCKNQLDHAWRTGRPCVIIDTDDEYDYFLPLSGTVSEKANYYRYRKEYFELNDDQFLYLEKGNKNGTVEMGEYFRKKISGYRVIGKLTEEAYLQLIKRISSFHKASLEELAQIATKK